MKNQEIWKVETSTSNFIHHNEKMKKNPKYNPYMSSMMFDVAGPAGSKTLTMAL